MLLAALSHNFAAAQVVPKDDKRITTQMIEVASPSGSGTIKGYLCRPASAGNAPLPAVDERINAAWPAYEVALKAAGIRYTAYTYAGTQHGFNNDTTPRFDAAVAKLAWDRTMAFFAQNLKA